MQKKVIVAATIIGLFVVGLGLFSIIGMMATGACVEYNVIMDSYPCEYAVYAPGTIMISIGVGLLIFALRPQTFRFLTSLAH